MTAGGYISANVDLAYSGFGWPRQRFKGRGVAGGGRRPTSFFSRVWVSSRVLVEREGRGVLPWYKLSRSRGGINIDSPSCRSYLGGSYIYRQRGHTYMGK